MLNQGSLKTALEGLAAHPGATADACATAWTNAVVAFFGAVTPPSTTAAAGQAALKSALLGAFQADSLAATALAMDAAFAAYAATLGGGMAPAFAATPPAGVVDFAQLFAPPFSRTHSAAATKVAARLFAWAVTGTATPVPSGAPVLWS